MTADRLVLTVKPDDLDVLHRNPREECNTDDAARRLNVDPDTADALLLRGQAVRCQNCNPEDPAHD